MKEFLGRIRFFVDKIKYRRDKHFYITTVIILLLVALSFTVIYADMQIEIKRKENILKSYYEEINTAGSGTEAKSTAGVSAYDSKTGSGNEYGYQPEAGDRNTGNVENDGIYNSQAEGDNLEENSIKAYICGNVKNPGVYEIETGARVVDLLELAGGEDINACVQAVNLAQFVVDGQRIYIPSKDETLSGDYSFFMDSSMAGYNSEARSIVNINTAGINELDTLPGIGPSIARNIVKYRNENGPFKAKGELKNVTGIGEKKYDEVREYISI
jgi:competence protein ComEA